MIQRCTVYTCYIISTWYFMRFLVIPTSILKNQLLNYTFMTLLHSKLRNFLHRPIIWLLSGANLIKLLVHTTLEICANGWQKPVVHLSVTGEIWNFQFKKFADLLITFPFQKTPTCIIMHQLSIGMWRRVPRHHMASISFCSYLVSSTPEIFFVYVCTVG